MSEAKKFFDEYQRKTIAGLYTCGIGRIITYDPAASKADVELLPDGHLIKSVPVSMPQTSELYVRMPYQRGDHVLVVFSHRDIDAIMYENGGTPSQRMLDMNDAIVVQGINLFSDTLPVDDEDKDNLVIGQKDGEAKISIGHGKINLTGDVFVNGAQI